MDHLPPEILRKIAMRVMASADTWRLGCLGVVSMALLSKRVKDAVYDDIDVWRTELVHYFPERAHDVRTPEDARGVLRVLSLGPYLTGDMELTTCGGLRARDLVPAARVVPWMSGRRLSLYSTAEIASRPCGLSWEKLRRPAPTEPHEETQARRAAHLLLRIERFLEREGVVTDAVREAVLYYVFEWRGRVNVGIRRVLARVRDAVRALRACRLDPDRNIPALRMHAILGTLGKEDMVDRYRESAGRDITWEAAEAWRCLEAAPSAPARDPVMCAVLASMGIADAEQDS